MRVDAAVIGGGVVGLAVAARLADRGMSVALLERHPTYGWEASSRSSEVVHAGLYYPPGSLKARLCVAGNAALRAWCGAHDVPLRDTGKFIVATGPDDAEYLGGLLERAGENGVPGVRWAAPGELAAAEPSVQATAALWSPTTAVVDSHALMESLARCATARGAYLAFGHAVVGACRRNGAYVLAVREPGGGKTDLVAGRVVNAAGLSADLVAALPGLDVDAAGYHLVYVRGCYFRLSERWAGRLRHLVYPVPHQGLTGLGVHVTLDIAGGLRLGPDVEVLGERVQEYRVDPARAAWFAEAARRFLPDLRDDDLRPDQAGIRARRIVPGGGAPDFVVQEEGPRGLSGWVNLIGIESPGLTCALTLADEVHALVA